MPVAYSSEKIRKKIGFDFQPLEEVLVECARNFRESGSETHS
jgi:hypothetical protein